MSIKHYVGEIGTDVILDTTVDISTATLVAIKVNKPDGTAVTWTGTVTSTTKVKHTLASGDFSLSGKYQMQAYVESGSAKWWGETFEIVVYDLYE